MREIKFKAFWKDILKPIPDFMEEYDCNAFTDENMIILQYTGHKDKNGTEIYEGDEILIESDYCSSYNGCITEVIYKGSSFIGRDPEINIGAWDGSVEVIGSEYENTKLIKEGK